MPNITQKQIADNYLAYLQGQNSNINASAPFSYWSIIAGAEGSVFLDLYANLDIVSKAIYIQNLQGSQIDNKLYESGLTPRGALTVSVIGVTFTGSPVPTPSPTVIPANSQFQTTNGIIYTLYQDASYIPPILNAANFSTSSTGGIAPLVVNFTDLTNPVPDSWIWSVTGGTLNTDYSFTNGTSATSQNPQITFNRPTTYSVTLTPVKQNVVYTQKSISIVVSAVGSISSNYSYVLTPPSGQVPVIANFTDLTQPLPTSWAWTVNGATSGLGWSFTNETSNTSQNPQITFTIAGSYIVTLQPTSQSVTYISKSDTITLTVALYATIGGSTTFLGYNTQLTSSSVIATTVTSTAGQNQESDQSCVNRLLLQKRSPNCGARIGDYFIYAKEASTAVTDAITVGAYKTIDSIKSLGVFPLIGSFITENQLNAGLSSIVYPPTPIPPTPTTFTQYTRQIDVTTLGIVNTYILSLDLLGLDVIVNYCQTYPVDLSLTVFSITLPSVYSNIPNPLDGLIQIPSLDVNNNVITISISIRDLIKREIRRVICNQPYGATDSGDPNFNYITLNDIVNGLNYQLSYSNGQIAKLLLDVQILGGNLPVPKPQFDSQGNPQGVFAGIYDILTDYTTINIEN